jgi:hypothetical protein
MGDGMSRIQLIDADTGEPIRTHSIHEIAFAKGDPHVLQMMDQAADMILAGFQPAGECRSGTVRTHKALLCVLNKNPWIKRFNTTPRRLMVHSADWNKYLLQNNDALDTTAANAVKVFHELEQARKRQDEIRRQKDIG